MYSETRFVLNGRQGRTSMSWLAAIVEFLHSIVMSR